VAVQKVFPANGANLPGAEKAGQVDLAKHSLNRPNIAIGMGIQMRTATVA
jgi:hypothetical protein